MAATLDCLLEMMNALREPAFPIPWLDSHGQLLLSPGRWYLKWWWISEQVLSHILLGKNPNKSYVLGPLEVPGLCFCILHTMVPQGRWDNVCTAHSMVQLNLWWGRGSRCHYLPKWCVCSWTVSLDDAICCRISKIPGSVGTWLSSTLANGYLLDIFKVLMLINIIQVKN